MKPLQALVFGGFLGSKDLWLKTDLWDTKVSGLGLLSVGAAACTFIKFGRLKL